ARNPKGWAEVERAERAVRDWQLKHAQARDARLGREAAISRQNEARQKVELQRFKDVEDDKYTRWRDKALPQYSTAEGKARLHEAAFKVLRGTGLTDAQIKQQWDSGHLRPAGFQQVIALAAAHLDTQERAREGLTSKRVPAPQSLRPGTYRPAGSGAEEQVRDLERQLDGASGNNALKLATRLTRARRAAGTL